VKVVQSFQETAISVIWATFAAAAAQSAVMLLSYLILGVPAAVLGSVQYACLSHAGHKTLGFYRESSGEDTTGIAE
jgi:hypothetical protein